MRGALRALLQVDEPPQRLALAFAVGVWIGFSPLLGLHTWMAIATAIAFRLNRLALLAGAWLNAWTAIPALALGTTLGCWVLGVSPDGLSRIQWGEGGLRLLTSLVYELRPFLWPFLFGNALLGIPLALVGYFGLLLVLSRRRGRAPAGAGGLG